MDKVQLIEEVPGLYGTFRVEENVIQKIWAEQDFNVENLHTSCGMKLKVVSPRDLESDGGRARL